jgi:hypothetical protein
MTGELRTSKLSPKNYYELCTASPCIPTRYGCPLTVGHALVCLCVQS